MRKGIEGFQSKRLAQGLAARGLSQQALSDLTGKSTASVSKWINGTQLPEGDALELMASALKLKQHWFLKPVPDYGDRPFLMRSLKSRERVASERMFARLLWAQELTEFLGQMVDFPDTLVPDLSAAEPCLLEDSDIEFAAEECRRLWRLGDGPIPDVLLALENAGVIVIREDAGTARIEGASRWCGLNARPFVYLSADKENGFRSRFDAAHELGHLVMHRSIDPKAAEKEHDLLEEQAHRFAGAFLMPSKSFAAEFPSYPTLDSLLVLKQRWKASVGAIIKRGQALGLLDGAACTRLWKSRSARWGARMEPGDDSIRTETPRLLQRAIMLLIESGNYPRASFSDSLGLSNNDIERLAFLPAGFFTTEPAKVIGIEELRLRRQLSERGGS